MVAFPDRARPASTAKWAATVVLLLVCGLGACSDSRAAPVRELHVCSDPNNLPFSNQREEGFENRIADLIADEMGAQLEYTWWAQRRGFVRNTLRAGDCDLIIGIPTSIELASTTRPYYRSTYVFVYRKDAGIEVRSFDDPILREVSVGVHLIGDDYANTPPAHALATRGIIDNQIGYRIYGDYSQESPPARLIDAVVDGEVDIAIAWGPLAAYFGARSPVELEIVPVQPQIDLPFLPMVYDISLGVRREDPALLAEVEAIMTRRRGDIDRILEEYGVPRLDVPDYRDEAL